MLNTIHELGRRNVFRVAGAYAIVGWLLAQIAVTLETSLNLPDWFDTVIVSALLIGFPIALLFAWAFEITPEGVKRTSGVAEDESTIKQTERRLDIALLGGLGLIVALMGYQLSTRTADQNGATNITETQATETDMASIAVLPFVDLSDTGDQDYFSDGISEEILNVLARVDGLKVASRTSSFQFKNQEGVSIPEIANVLGVVHILEGSVRKAGDNIRITAQLIKAGSDEHLWSETFDRTLTVENLFQIQDEIATGIVSQLGERMDLGRANTLRFAAAADTKNLRAYEAYLEGRKLLPNRSSRNLQEIINKLETATELDPGFARAWETLAVVNYVAPAYTIPGTDKETFEQRAITAAEAALALDADAPLAVTIAGGGKRVLGLTDHAQWLKSLNAGLAIDPNEGILLGWRGQELTWLGFFEDAETDLRRAMELDPTDGISAGWLVRNLIMQKRLDDALRLFRSQEDLLGGNSQVRGMLTLALMANGDSQKAKALFNEGAQKLPPNMGLDIDLIEELFFNPSDDPQEALDDLYEAFGPLGDMMKQEGVPSDLSHHIGDYESITLDNSPSWDLIPWVWNRPNFLISPHRYRVMREQGLETYWRENGFPPQCRMIDPLADGRDFECD